MQGVGHKCRVWDISAGCGTLVIEWDISEESGALVQGVGHCCNVWDISAGSGALVKGVGH